MLVVFCAVESLVTYLSMRIYHYILSIGSRLNSNRMIIRMSVTNNLVLITPTCLLLNPSSTLLICLLLRHLGKWLLLRKSTFNQFRLRQSHIEGRCQGVLIFVHLVIMGLRIYKVLLLKNLISNAKSLSIT